MREMNRGAGIRTRDLLLPKQAEKVHGFYKLLNLRAVLASAWRSKALNRLRMARNSQHNSQQSWDESSALTWLSLQDEASRTNLPGPPISAGQALRGPAGLQQDLHSMEQALGECLAHPGDAPRRARAPQQRHLECLLRPGALRLAR
jgi:hypothetical protein